MIKHSELPEEIRKFFPTDAEFSAFLDAGTYRGKKIPESKTHLIHTPAGSADPEVMCGIKFSMKLKMVHWSKHTPAKSLEEVTCKNCQRPILALANKVYGSVITDHLKKFFNGGSDER